MSALFTQKPDSNPVVDAFLGFLAQDMENHPERVASLPKSAIERAQKLTEGISVSDDELIPDDTTL